MIPNNVFANDETKKEFNKIKEIEKNVDREKLLYKANGNTYDFRKFNTIRTFGKNIYEVKINLEEPDKDQSDLLNEIKNFSEKMRPKSYNKRQEKEIACDNLHTFYDGREMVLNSFKSGVFPTKFKVSGILNTDNPKLKILMAKQMLKRSPIALAQVKAGNNSENLLIEIRQIIYSLYQSKEITKNLSNNLIKSL